jgi:hypothetical protein
MSPELHPARAPGVPRHRAGVRRLPGPEGFFDAKKPASFRLGTSREDRDGRLLAVLTGRIRRETLTVSNPSIGLSTVRAPSPTHDSVTELSPRFTSDWSPAATSATESSLHQLAPYIGRLKINIARHYIEKLTKPGDVVVDPFCGSGVVPLEAALLQRRAIAGDWNPYAFVLSSAKLRAPRTLESALSRFEIRWKDSRKLLAAQDLRKVPDWVRTFFHTETLRSALAFRDACVVSDDVFLLACLLGILHHQRPGFLSFPSSHLVPYLRNRKFPRSRFPQLYTERDVAIRLQKKIQRAYRRTPPSLDSARSKIFLSDARSLPVRQQVNLVLTSPPYMNELDYVRDNRLRLWFIDRKLPDIRDVPRGNRKAEFSALMRDVFLRLLQFVRPGGHIVLILGESTRGTTVFDTANAAHRVITQESRHPSLTLIDLVHDHIPDIRRSRRGMRGTKLETILTYRRS